MKMKLSDYVAMFVVKNDISNVFTVTGGGAMHLNDSLGHHPGLRCVYSHHEQASAIAAEAYTRLSGRAALVCVTSGPGGTNALTGVLGGWLDSIPMLVISGQVKRETTIHATDIPLRQLGDQEYNIIESVRPMTKYAAIVLEPNEIRYHLEKALYLATNGRGGPCWLDIPLDVQASQIDPDTLKGFESGECNVHEMPTYDTALTNQLLEKVQKAQKPVILAGSGVRLSGEYDLFLQVVNKLQIPVLTAWNAHDLLWDDHPLFCGRPGSLGTRGGNFITQGCDLLLALGCRLNVRQISYNYKMFAKNAYKIIVDIDSGELQKPTVIPDMKIHADVGQVMKSILLAQYTPNTQHRPWLARCREINERYPATTAKHYEKITPVNPYAFTQELFDVLPEDQTVICGNGSACVVSFQAGKIKKGQRLFTNSGCAAMGYGFPAAIGACFASKGERIICIDGDGSFQMNLQELQTVVYHQLNLKIFYFNNNGYHSIRQTQTNLFAPPLVGVCDGNGISFPDMKKISQAYGIGYQCIKNIQNIHKELGQVLEAKGPVLCEVILDEKQNFEPKLSSRVMPDGQIVSPEIDDMFPFLSREEYEAVKKEILSI